MDYQPPADQAALGHEAGGRVQHPAADELLDLPPLTGPAWRLARPIDERPEISRPGRGPLSARERPRARVLAEPGGTGRHRGVPGAPPPGVPAGRVRADGPRQPPQLPEADGGLARPRRPHRLHPPARREDRPLRPPARGDRPRPAALLRHGDAARRATPLAVLVESHEGRPTKIEGNPEHPASLGATDAFAQASILGLYDPDRSPTALTFRGDIRHLGRVPDRRQDGGRGTAGARAALASASSPGPSPRRRWRDQIQRLLAEFPALEWHQWEPVRPRPGARPAPGSPSASRSKPTTASSDARRHPLARRRLPGVRPGQPPSGSREFAAGRRVTGARREMNRLYAVEADAVATRAPMADHRLPLQASADRGLRARPRGRARRAAAVRQPQRRLRSARLGRRRSRATCRPTAAPAS